MKILAVLAAAAAATATWAPVFGSSLVSIGVLDPANPLSAVYAVSQDGAYAVGYSRSANPSFPGISFPVVWSAADGLVELPCPSGNNTRADGVSVGLSANAGNIIITGLHENYITRRYYKAPLTNLASGAWADCGNAAGVGTSNFRSGTANNLRSHPTGVNADGRWYVGGQRNDNKRVCRLRGDPTIGWDGSSPMTGNSVSAYGVVVGRYTGVSPSTARWDSPIGGELGDVPGSDGVRADGFGISPGFGISTATDFEVQWICGQAANYWTNTVPTIMMQAFRWNRADAAMTFLGSLAPAGGGDTENNSSVAYTVADNGVTAGRSYFGDSGGGTVAAYEVATVWDTSGTWDNTGTPKSLKDLLDADGVDTSAWTSLSLVYAASDDGKVLGGYGVWAADGSTQGFVAVKTITAPVVVQVTNITVSGSTVTLSFSSSNTSDTTASFVVQEAGTLVNAATVFNDMTSGVTITGSAGAFQATFAPSGSQHFYRIKHL